MNDKKREIEIESLNLDHLDVEELENRLEMAVGVPQVGCTMNICGVNSCGQNG